MSRRAKSNDPDLQGRVANLRKQGYSYRKIQAALEAGGMHVSLSTICKIAKSLGLNRLRNYGELEQRCQQIETLINQLREGYSSLRRELNQIKQILTELKQRVDSFGKPKQQAAPSKIRSGEPKIISEKQGRFWVEKLVFG